MDRTKKRQLICTVVPAVLLAVFLCDRSPMTSGQAPQAGAAQSPAAAGGRGGGYVSNMYEPDDNTGFVPIFDGKTLKDWDGDPTFWRVENGEIIGESTPDKVLKLNTFLIWRGGKVKDFELKADFKLSGTAANSGIQYRSIELPDVGKWVLKGYQADMDITNNPTGNVHEERGRKVLAPRGMLTRLTDGPKFKTVATIGDSTLLRGVVNVEGWNTYHIIARGPVVLQIINGHLVAATIDEDSKDFIPEGLVGLQMHVGPPFKVEFRNILYRNLD